MKGKGSFTSLTISLPFNNSFNDLTLPAIIYSKLAIETLEQDVKYVVNGVVLVSLLTSNIFHTLSSVSIVNLEHAFADWEWENPKLITDNEY